MKLKTEVQFIERNGRTLSKRTAFYENGQIAEVGIYGNSQNGWNWSVPVGVIKSFFDNGQLKSEVQYNDHGALDGECFYYNSQGKLLRKMVYSNDKMVEEQSFENEDVI